MHIGTARVDDRTDTACVNAEPAGAIVQPGRPSVSARAPGPRTLAVLARHRRTRRVLDPALCLQLFELARQAVDNVLRFRLECGFNPYLVALQLIQTTQELVGRQGFVAAHRRSFSAGGVYVYGIREGCEYNEGGWQAFPYSTKGPLAPQTPTLFSALYSHPPANECLKLSPAFTQTTYSFPYVASSRLSSTTLVIAPKTRDWKAERANFMIPSHSLARDFFSRRTLLSGHPFYKSRFFIKSSQLRNCGFVAARTVWRINMGKMYSTFQILKQPQSSMNCTTGFVGGSSQVREENDSHHPLRFYKFGISRFIDHLRNKGKLHILKKRIIRKKISRSPIKRIPAIAIPTEIYRSKRLKSSVTIVPRYQPSTAHIRVRPWTKNIPKSEKKFIVYVEYCISSKRNSTLRQILPIAVEIYPTSSYFWNQYLWAFRNDVEYARELYNQSERVLGCDPAIEETWKKIQHRAGSVNPELLESLPITASTKDWNFAISQLVKNGHLNRAEIMLSRMATANVPQDEYSYTPIMNYYASQGDHTRVISMIKRVELLGMTLGPVSHGIVLNAFIKAGDYDRAYGLFQTFTQKTAHMYSMLLIPLSSVNPELCLQLAIEAFNGNHILAEAAWSRLFWAVRRTRTFEQLIHVYNMMSRQGVYGDIRCYNALLMSLIKFKGESKLWKTKQARKLLLRIIQQNLFLDKKSWSILRVGHWELIWNDIKEGRNSTIMNETDLGIQRFMDWRWGVLDLHVQKPRIQKNERKSQWASQVHRLRHMMSVANK
ncbi:Pentatricopeptide repeat-containing protein, mitochondrial [Neolecta irregularis DAH-3]|uniref:Pentatricopeptide repeat-containing protein, mitochondrial n=1 Tax=Neolecta irregularis (strain DAH-3) TaxID=1198029 RepID=A0A1U7LMR4_NEOID|nr:Pentatricopeptide repeat-containing protein, mitochondrial [Neolecta irregularis DAH-3]|eukprot:OLL23944.1 Pentatricopeptide repeat-containing protein, mitochondrial [Neolecta irregularis DAH-3]